MSRSYNEHPRKTRDDEHKRSNPIRQWTIWERSVRNPAASYRQMWREQARHEQNRQLRECRDFEELHIESRISRITNIYDWY